MTFYPGAPFVLSGKKLSRYKINLRTFCKKQGIKFIQGEVSDIKKKSLVVNGKKLKFSNAIIATGTRSFLIPGVNHAFKEMNEVKDILKVVRKAKRVIVVGGGVTGVEVAMELRETCNKEVVVVEGLKRILSEMTPRIAKYITRYLRNEGVDVRTGSFIKKITKKQLLLENGDKIKHDLVIWCGGTRPRVFPGFKTTKEGILVNSQLQTSIENVYAVGDCASRDGRHAPSTARNATIQARIAAKNILATMYGGRIRTYNVHTYPLFISLGNRSAVAVWKKYWFAGRLFRWAKTVIELHYLYQQR